MDGYPIVMYYLQAKQGIYCTDNLMRMGNKQVLISIIKQTNKNNDMDIVPQQQHTITSCKVLSANAAFWEVAST